jgi:hypothetical protein
MGIIACVIVGLCAALAAAVSTGAVRFSSAGVQQETARPEVSAISPNAIYEGVISDTHCGAKHAASINEFAADCTRRCVHAGEQFVLIDRDTSYVLDGDMPLLKKLAGERVRVIGTLEGKTIRVENIVGL